MGKFSLIILWRSGESSMEKGLSWHDLMSWMESIHQTASQDLIRNVLIHPEGEQMVHIGPFNRTLNAIKEKAA